MKRILVTGAGGSAAANFINSLRISPEKFYIVGVDNKPFHLELADVDKRYLIPLPNSKKYIATLNKIITKENIALVHAQPDNEVLTLAKLKNQLKAKVFLPALETLETLANKALSHQKWQNNQVKVPDAYYLEKKEGLAGIIKTLLKKHEVIWVRATKGAGSKASLPINNLKQAEGWLDYWINRKGLQTEDFMFSEFLPGKEYAFQSIWKDGRLITSAARERIEYIFGHLTPSGQTSSPSIAKSVHNEKVNQTATKAVLAIDPKATGIFCVDLKENKKKEICVMEINAGRFFTTSNFFAHAGSNMPYYYLKLAFGEPLEKLPQYNSVPKDLYWVRMTDLGYKLIKDGAWTSEKITDE